MRIAIDLQACQGSSQNRGIGRYSLNLTKSMVKLAGPHELLLVLNGNFRESLEHVRLEFADLLPRTSIKTFSVPSSSAYGNASNAASYTIAQLLRESYIANLGVDFLHTSSLFEGLSDDVTTSIGRLDHKTGQSVTLYDMIPLLRPSVYLANSVVRGWYFNKLQSIKRADILLSISESSRKEAIHSLGIPADQIVNISSAVDSTFRRLPHDTPAFQEVRHRYGLPGEFALYTGGIDHRKNIEGLIEAFSLIPYRYRKDYRLAIVCAINEDDRKRLAKVGDDNNLRPESLVFTGYVPEEDLIALYNICTFFVFPSLHEGFGLPVLEAMACGAAAIGADNSSIPEVIGRKDALFDATRPKAIAEKMTELARNSGFRDELREYGLERATVFSWDTCARRALDSIVSSHERIHSRRTICLTSSRPKLAFVAPLPPAKSGIADYCSELLPELACFYDIELVVDQDEVIDSWINSNFKVRSVRWFESHASTYDRVLYQFGNSQFHAYMIDFLKRFPGTVVLHDFFLSGLHYWMEYAQQREHHFSRSIIESHGYKALALTKQFGPGYAIMEWPINLGVIQQSYGLIVHSQYSMRLAAEYYGSAASDKMRHVPFFKLPPSPVDGAARVRIRCEAADFLVCSFGYLAPTKKNAELLESFLASSLANDPNCHLVFVGQNHEGTYGDDLLDVIKKKNAPCKVTITGFVDRATYHDYLAAADVTVQLRTQSRGETSAAVFDCLAYGRPLVINAHATMGELPAEIVIKLPDDFSTLQLTTALEELKSSPLLRAELSSRGSTHIATHHSPRLVAQHYRDAIEEFAALSTAAIRSRLLASISSAVDGMNPSDPAILRSAQCYSANAQKIRQPHLMFDISLLIQSELSTVDRDLLLSVFRMLFDTTIGGFRYEPVYFADDVDGGHFRYAHQYCLRSLASEDVDMQDDVVDAKSEDVFFSMGSQFSEGDNSSRVSHLRQWRAMGVRFGFTVPITTTSGLDSSVSEASWGKYIPELGDLILGVGREALRTAETLLWQAPALKRWPLYLVTFDGDAPADSLDPQCANSAHARQILETISRFALGDSLGETYTPKSCFRFYGSDERLRTMVGEKKGNNISAIGTAGYLLYGPYLSLPPGHYRLELYGTGRATGVKLDVSVDKGKKIIAKAEMDNLDEGGVVLLGSIEFGLARSSTDLEVRVWVDEVTTLAIQKIEIRSAELLTRAVG